MEKVESTEFICEPFHCDFTGHLTLSVLGNHLLNCAGQHASHRGFGIAHLNEEEHTWVLSRMVIEFSELPSQYETFRIETWVESVYRLFTDRNFSIYNHSGKAIGYARTTWAMIGMKSRKPIDLSNLNNGLITSYTLPEKECPIAKSSRIKVSAPIPCSSFTAQYSDIDINGHVNSVRYIEHILDHFSLEYLKQHPLKRFEIAYVNESYCGDRLDLYVEQANQHGEGDSYDIEIRKSDIVICRSKVIF